MVLFEALYSLPLKELTPVVTKVPDGGIDMQLLSLILSIVAVALSVVALIINIRANRKRKKELENERHDRSTGE